MKENLKTIRAYIAGPMAGVPDLNKHAFRSAEAWLMSDADVNSSHVTIPHDVEPHVHSGECPGGYRSSPTSPHAAACYLRTDLIAMLERAHEVWVLPGWESSVGARLEVQVAAACGLPIRFIDMDVVDAYMASLTAQERLAFRATYR